MFPKLKTFYKPQTPEEAQALLARADVRTMALYGGPELFDDLDTTGTIEAVVSLAGLGRDKVTVTESALHIGALLPLTALPQAPWRRRRSAHTA